MGKPTAECRVCGAVRMVIADGLCSPCYQYRRRNGRDRPDHVLADHGIRLMERHMVDTQKAHAFVDSLIRESERLAAENGTTPQYELRLMVQAHGLRVLERQMRVA